jgi:membrane-associated protease RseP (regulator of RpoE activity)
MLETIASAESEAERLGVGGAANALGMELLPLDPQRRKELNVPKDVNGVAVGQVTSNRSAGELGIQPGDIIVSVDQKPVTTPENAAAQLKEVTARGTALLLINRHGINQFVGLSPENTGTAGSSRCAGEDQLRGDAATSKRTSSSGRKTIPTSSKARWMAATVVASGS